MNRIILSPPAHISWLVKQAELRNTWQRVRQVNGSSAGHILRPAGVSHDLSRYLKPHPIKHTNP